MQTVPGEVYGPYATEQEARRAGEVFTIDPSIGGFIIDELPQYGQFTIMLLPPNGATTQNLSPAPSRAT